MLMSLPSIQGSLHAVGAAMGGRGMRFGAALLITSVLVGCGGSGKLIEPFVPKRVVAFGDESSLILPDGRKYAVNGLLAAGGVDCNINPIWVQKMSNGLGVPMRECPPASTATTTTVNAPSLTRAAANATVDTLAAQVDAHLQSDTLGDKDLVTMFVGLHDILAEYATVATSDEATATARLQARGRALAAQVNRVAQAGPPVLVVTIPNVGQSPYGRAQEVAKPGSAELLGRLTSAFNIAMRLDLINDGRLIGLVDGFDLTRAFVTLPSGFVLTNITEPACLAATPTPDCSTATLNQVNGTSVSPAQYMWADTLHLGPTFHDRLGGIAEARARNNPF